MMGNKKERLEQIKEILEELAQMGLIYDSGRRRNGKIVWVATPGKEAGPRCLKGRRI
jgi:hypothetical protein